MFKFFEVGGKVRDELLGLISKDVDFVAVYEDVTNYRPVSLGVNDLFEMLFVYLEHNGFKVFLATKSCLTIRAKFPKGHINEGLVADFVLARKEIGYKEGTREPIVIPGTLYDDLQRRDFTINAIARSADGELIDPFNGMQDLQDKILRTPIQGEVTFADDPLRLLRAIRFSVTKKFQISDEIKDILFNFDYEKKFHVISEERIREELYKAFRVDSHKTMLLLLWYPNLAKYIFTKTNLWLKPTNEE